MLSMDRSGKSRLVIAPFVSEMMDVMGLIVRVVQ